MPITWTPWRAPFSHFNARLQPCYCLIKPLVYQGHIKIFVAYINTWHYHEDPGNVMPDDVFFEKGEEK